MGLPMEKPVVANLTKSWGAVSKAQAMGWRKGGGSGIFPCIGRMLPHGEDEECRGEEMEISNGECHLPVTWGQGCWQSIHYSIPANLPKGKKGGSYLSSVSKGFNIIPEPPGHLP